jgi:hypothetical protein
MLREAVTEAAEQVGAADKSRSLLGTVWQAVRGTRR